MRPGDETTVEGRLFDGRYRMIRRIGSGGMARVFLAEDVDLHRDVAIKVLHDRYSEDAQFVERFAREARAAAGLNHPNIVAIYDRGQSEGSYYIAMEYLDGETLKDVILREGPLPERRAIDITLQLLAALRFAHRREVIHRDVKPHNVMVLRGRPREGRRLRHRPRRRLRDDGGGLDRRYRPVPVAGAGARPARRTRVRPLLRRRRAVRDAHRPGARSRATRRSRSR